jgi:hypothetical protein
MYLTATIRCTVSSSSQHDRGAMRRAFRHRSCDMSLMAITKTTASRSPKTVDGDRGSDGTPRRPPARPINPVVRIPGNIVGAPHRADLHPIPAALTTANKRTVVEAIRRSGDRPAVSPGAATITYAG